MYPSTIPVNNNHRLVVLSPDQKIPDFERIEDLAADATLALRKALGLVHELRHETFRGLDTEITALQRRLDRRDAVSDPARSEIAAGIERARRFEQDESAQHLADRLDEALALSTRVADLLAAEREVSRLRSAGR